MEQVSRHSLPITSTSLSTRPRRSATQRGTRQPGHSPAQPARVRGGGVGRWLIGAARRSPVARRTPPATAAIRCAHAPEV